MGNGGDRSSAGHRRAGWTLEQTKAAMAAQLDVQMPKEGVFRQADGRGTGAYIQGSKSEYGGDRGQMRRVLWFCRIYALNDAGEMGVDSDVQNSAGGLPGTF